MKLPKLPSGVSILRDRSGDTEYWVLRLGKRWTGGPVVRKTFSLAGDARKAWEKEVSKLVQQPQQDDLSSGQP